MIEAALQRVILCLWKHKLMQNTHSLYLHINIYKHTYIYTPIYSQKINAITKRSLKLYSKISQTRDDPLTMNSVSDIAYN